MSGRLERSSITDAWLREHSEQYKAATTHSFTQSIRDGSIDVNNFKGWMGQDYHFVREFVRFVASVLLKVPRDAPEQEMDTVLGGLSALENEVSWFRKEANFWEIFLEKTTIYEQGKEYCKFLVDLEKESTPYAVAFTAFWAIELVYCMSFMACLEEGAQTPYELLSTVRRWGSQEFYHYTLDLKKLADKILETASEEERKQAKEVFVAVLEYEVKFWNMAGYVLG